MRRAVRARILVATWTLTSSCVGLSLAAVGRALTGWNALVLALFAGGFVAVVTSALATRWFDEAVRPLTDAARRMYEGDLTVRARVPQDQDIGNLGAAFDRLSESLSETVGELRAERDLVSRILDGMHEGVLLLDHQGKVALVNPALREMLLLRADLVGHPLLEVVRHADLKALLDRATKSRSTCSGEIEVGGLKPRRLLVRATAFQQSRAQDEGAADEGESGVLAVFFDVTEIRRLEALRREFVANVSHELRTPVTAVLSAAETLEIALDEDPEQAKRFLAIIERNAARLRRLIEDLLDLSRIESRELRLRPERFVFAPFANHLMSMFKDRADKRRLSLRSRVEPGTAVDADRRALEQVLTNLIDNAVKYCPEGSSVMLLAEPSDGPVPGVRLRVEDDGSGIDAKHLPRLFERFYRVDAGRSREMGGTGLGLSIVKHLVEAMGGTIDVTTEVGKGTTFEVIIPDASARAKEKSSSDDLGRDNPIA